MLLDLTKKINIKVLQNASFALIACWIIFPLLMMPLNLLSLNAETSYNIWSTVFYTVGDFAWVLSIPFFYHLLSAQKISRSKIMISLLPILLILLFGIWVFICDLKSQYVFLAFLAYHVFHDGFFGYVAYGGYIVLGLILSTSRTKLLKTANIFLSVAAIQAIITLMNNWITKKLCDNEYSTCPAYESVFYNSNHYGYYLVFCVFISAFLFLNADSNLKKTIYLLLESLFSVALSMNNTFGSHLAIFITLTFCLVWEFISKGNNKKGITAIFGVFVLSSLFTLLFSSEVLDNYKGLLIAIKTILFDNGDIMDDSVDEIGSGRGFLWKYTLEIARQNPIFGIGGQNVFESAHNMFIQIAAYFGFVGLGLYILIYVVGVKRLFNSRRTLTQIQKASSFIVIAYLISGFFGVTMFYTAPYFYFMLGICISGALKEIDVNELQKVSV